MKSLLNRLIEHQTLSQEEARNVLINMAEGKYNDSQISAFLTTYLMRSITIQELFGFREALLLMTRPVDLKEFDAVDIVGTGGDHKNTFNISTLSCFVTAGAGYKVAKHGNFGASSISGASNVLEHLGIKFSNDEDVLKRSIETSGVAYLHAPMFNEAMKRVAPARKSLGVRTLFNILGPLVNPSRPNKMLLGVFNLKLARLYSYLYQHTSEQFAIVNSLDGYDEISLTSPFKVVTSKGEFIYNPEDLDFLTCSQESLSGGDSVASAAQIFLDVLGNSATEAQKSCVLANSAFAIQTANNALTISECLALAKESLESGAAKKSFLQFQSLNS